MIPLVQKQEKPLINVCFELLAVFWFLKSLLPCISGREAGIRVMMITGDSKDTAVAIAKEVNILKESDTLSHSAFTGTLNCGGCCESRLSSPHAINRGRILPTLT